MAMPIREIVALHGWDFSALKKKKQLKSDTKRIGNYCRRWRGSFGSGKCESIKAERSNNLA